MKRFFLLLVSVFILTNIAFAAPVDSMEAKNLAQTFYSLHFPEQTRPVFEEISHSVGVEHFYIFNNTNGPGFVMVAGDDCAIPILGYSGANNAIVGELPDNIISWLGYYDGTINAAMLNGEVATPEIAELWNTIRAGNLPEPLSITAVSPLIATTWNQSAPYNNLCPGTGSNKAYVGCVATAMAQLMKYYNWPTTGTGSNSYVSNDGTYNYGTLSANFGATTYDWNNMLNSYPNTYSGTAAQQNAIATLSYHCGVAVNMVYSPEGSYAYTIGPNYPCAESALKEHFGYSQSLFGVYKQYYTNAQWISMLKNDLDQQHPIIYAGTDQNAQGGHCFICDGYDNNNNFHFNWGWEGSYDGYFALTSLTPYSGGIGGGNYDYSYYQQAIFGAVPDGGYTPPTPTDCEYLHYPLPGTLNFYVMASGNGYPTGTNTYGDIAKADYFTYSGSGSVEKLNVTFGAIDGTTGSIAFTVWESNNGTPGNVLGSKTVTLASVYNSSVNQGFNYECVFDNPIAVNGNFFAGIDFSGTASPIGILTTTDGDATNTGWEMTSDGQWYPYNSANSWQMSLTHAIHPYVCPVTNPDPYAGDYQLVMYEAFNYTPNPMQQGQSVTVSASVGNAGTNTFNGSFKLALFNANNTEVQVISQQSSNPIASMQYTPMTFSGTITAPAGTYQMALYYQATGSTTWTLVGNSFGVPNPITVTVSGGSTPPDPGGCDYLHFPPNSLNFYTFNDGNGYLSGTNVYGNGAIADYFTQSGSGTVQKIKIVMAAMDGTNGSVTFTVWADNNGSPGAVIGSKTVTLNDMYNVAASENGIYECTFDNPVNINGNFFAGLNLSNATSYFGVYVDSVATNTGWDYYDGEWSPYTDSWGLSLTNAIFPYVCSGSDPNPPVGGSGLNMYSDFVYTPDPLRQNTVAYVTVGVINMDNTAFTGNLRLALETTNGEHVQTIQQVPVTTPVAANSYGQINFSGNITAAPGFYNLILYYKPTGGSTWMTVGSDYNASFQNPKSVMVAYPNGIDDLSMDAVRLRPNPATDHFYLDVNDQTIDRLEIFTTTGQIVHTQSNVLNGESINISSLSSGVYFVRYETPDNVGTLKLVVK